MLIFRNVPRFGICYELCYINYCNLIVIELPGSKHLFVSIKSYSVLKNVPTNYTKSCSQLPVVKYQISLVITACPLCKISPGKYVSVHLLSVRFT